MASEDTLLQSPSTRTAQQKKKMEQFAQSTEALITLSTERTENKTQIELELQLTTTEQKSEAITKVQVNEANTAEDILEATDEKNEKLFSITKKLNQSVYEDFKWRQWADICLFALLIVIGVIIMAIKQHTDIGQLLIGSGLTPFILFAWSLCTASNDTIYKKNNYIRCGASLLLIVLGIILLLIHDTNDNVAVFFAFAVMNVGVFLIISRLFFMEKDAERTIEILRKQLKTGRRKAVGPGLAFAYFYNFLKPVCDDLYTEKDNKPGIAMSVKEGWRGKPEDCYLSRNEFTLLIPRNLTDAQQLRDSLQECKYTASVKNFTTHRPLSLYTITKWKSAMDEEVYCVGLCDVPNVLSSLYNRKHHSDKMQDAKTEKVDLPQEILTFQNELFELIQENIETKEFVRIVSMPAPPFTRDDLWAAVGASDLQIDEKSMKENK